LITFRSAAIQVRVLEEVSRISIAVIAPTKAKNDVHVKGVRPALSSVYSITALPETGSDFRGTRPRVPHCPEVGFGEIPVDLLQARLGQCSVVVGSKRVDGLICSA